MRSVSDCVKDPHAQIEGSRPGVDPACPRHAKRRGGNKRYNQSSLDLANQIDFVPDEIFLWNIRNIQDSELPHIYQLANSVSNDFATPNCCLSLIRLVTELLLPPRVR